MSLNYGFGLYGNTDECKELGTKKFEALSETDKKFYHEVLPWALMIVDIGVVSKSTIPHIVARMKVIEPLYWKDTLPEEIEQTSANIAKYLMNFTGFQANIHTTSLTEFGKKLTNRIKNDTGIPLSKSDISPDIKTILMEK